MSDYELGIDAHTVLNALGRSYEDAFTLDTFFRLDSSEELSTEDLSVGQKQNLSYLRSAGLAEKRRDFTQPTHRVYSLNSCGERVYEVVESYDVNEIALDGLVRDIVGMDEAYSGFIAGIEGDNNQDEVSQILDVDPFTVTRYADRASDLGILHRNHSFLGEVTHLGRDVQSFVRDIGDILEGEEDSEEEPVWAR